MSDDDGYEPYQWQVGDPEDWGDSVGVPDIPYMGYLNGDDDDDEDDCRRPPIRHPYHDEAWELRNQGRYAEALDEINLALDYDDKYFDNWNVKAIILEDMARYDEAIECYDRALELNTTQTVKNNKAYSLSMLADREKYKDHDWQKALGYINEALKLVSDDDSRKKTYLHIKGNIMESLGRRVDARVCHLLADGMTDMVQEIELQQKIIRNINSPLINVTGTRFYRGMAPFTKGAQLTLIREMENKHDHDAIRVEIDGETVGYVANSDYTLIDGIESATSLKHKLKKNQKATVMFIHAQEYVIAKLE